LYIPPGDYTWDAMTAPASVSLCQEAGRTLVSSQEHAYSVQEARAMLSFDKPHVIWMQLSAD